MHLRTWKLLRSILFAGLVTGVTVFAIGRGAEPTTTATAAILAILLFGGVEVRELIAARRALLGGVVAEAASRDGDSRPDAERSEGGEDDAAEDAEDPD